MRSITSVRIVRLVRPRRARNRGGSRGSRPSRRGGEGRPAPQRRRGRDPPRRSRRGSSTTPAVKSAGTRSITTPAWAPTMMPVARSRPSPRFGQPHGRSRRVRTSSSVFRQRSRSRDEDDVGVRIVDRSVGDSELVVHWWLCERRRDARHGGWPATTSRRHHRGTCGVPRPRHSPL